MIDPSLSNDNHEYVETAFPLKLHVVLDEAEKRGFSDVISWQGNKAFMIHKPKKFQDSIMSEYFNQTEYKSFQKQLKLHGFTRFAVGEQFGGAYTHTFLVRNNSNMGQFMVPAPAKLKKANLLRRSTDAITTSIPSTPTRQPQHVRHGRVLGRSNGGLPQYVEDDWEPIPHDDNENGVLDCDGYDHRKSKKHRSNKSWNPTLDTGVDSKAAMEWFYSSFGKNIETPSAGEAPALVEDVEVDDIHSIHSFSSQPIDNFMPTNSP